MTIKNQNKNISAEIDVTQLFDIEVEHNNEEITAVKLTRKDFYNDETKTTYDLMDYFYTEQEIDNFVKIHLVVYDSFSQLPQNNGISAGKSNYIYLVPDADSGGIEEGIYKEYVWVKIKDSSKYRTNETDHNDYILDEDHYNYEMLGSTEMDLSQIRRDIANLQSDKLDKTKVIDNLTTSTYNSSDPTALSAKQGKNLQDNKVDKTSIATNLTTDDDTKVLSAKQGKNLQDNKIDKTSIVTNLTTDDDTKVLSAKQGKDLQDNKVDKSSIVDSVTDANTNPVTSNAVFDTILDVLDQLQSSSLLLSSNQPIIQNNENSRLVARIYGDITSNNNILFYEKKTDATDILLDTVSTTNGVAIYSYSGTGAGKKEFYAKYGTLVSETCNVLDCITTTNTHDSWVIGTNVAYEDLDNGVHFTGVNTNTDRAILKQTNNTYLNSNSDWCIDFKLSCANIMAIYFKNGADGADITNASTGNLGIDYTTENTVKFTYDASTGKVTPNVNGVNKTALDISSITSDTVDFAFVDWQGDMDITITDFKIYPV